LNSGRISWAEDWLENTLAFWEERRRSPVEGLKDAHIGFTGRMTELSRAEAFELARKAGAGRVTDSVSATIDYLVVGGLGSKQWKEPGKKGTKLIQMEEYLKLGLVDTKVITEEEFLLMAGRGSES
jgi:NAD-dependent DNA ligase